MNNIEIWKEITNFSKYEISYCGNIKNKENQIILKLSEKIRLFMSIINR
jgi:hypothetical protein